MSFVALGKKFQTLCQAMKPTNQVKWPFCLKCESNRSVVIVFSAPLTSFSILDDSLIFLTFCPDSLVSPLADLFYQVCFFIKFFVTSHKFWQTRGRAATKTEGSFLNLEIMACRSMVKNYKDTNRRVRKCGEITPPSLGMKNTCLNPRDRIAHTQK